MSYIRGVHVTHPGTHCEHVGEVRFSETTSGPLQSASREWVHRSIVAGQSFQTYNSRTGASAPVVARANRATGTRYIATVANDVETDNLLRLPRY